MWLDALTIQAVEGTRRRAAPAAETEVAAHAQGRAAQARRAAGDAGARGRGRRRPRVGEDASRRHAAAADRLRGRGARGVRAAEDLREGDAPPEVRQPGGRGGERRRHGPRAGRAGAALPGRREPGRAPGGVEVFGPPAAQPHGGRAETLRRDAGAPDDVRLAGRARPGGPAAGRRDREADLRGPPRASRRHARGHAGLRLGQAARGTDARDAAVGHDSPAARGAVDRVRLHGKPGGGRPAGLPEGLSRLARLRRLRRLPRARLRRGGPARPAARRLLGAAKRHFWTRTRPAIRPGRSSCT